jgi:ABC-2 type transport system permease protein
MNALTAKGFPVLIRREFWEHRALWMAPLVIAGLYLLVCLIPGSHGIDGSRHGPNAGMMTMLYVQLIFTGVLFALMSVVVFFYLADCLYAERKDRSILFWKSLPVSDAATVLSKVLVASLVVPLGVYVLAVITNVLAFGILYARLHSDAVFGQFIQWSTGDWLRLNGMLLADVLIVSLWYAPVVAYQLLMSAWAKGSVMVWTIIPPLLLMLGERLLFGTWYVGRLIGERVGINLTGVAIGHRPTPRVGGLISNSSPIFDQIDAFGLLATPDIWIGVAVAAVLIFLTIRIRRYRDDT